jgi:asparagine synthase (glutamine-hydrolysing)
MCGFVALFAPRGGRIDPPLLDRMTDSLAHRGPDGRGTRVNPGCGLGHRRLSIIDLAGGDQPIRGKDDRVLIVYNGETYNYREVKETLPGPWRTNSDTEVFLRSYEERGISGFEPLVGTFGAAIWDGRRNELVVVRDRLGIKPVYYVELPGGGYAFASEIRALLLHPEVKRKIDPIALDQLLTYRYVPAPRTTFEGIRKLPPGHVAIASDRGLELVRWWSPRPDPKPLPDDEAEALFLRSFDDAVASRMVSDVPVGIFLSGGVDSAAVLQSMGTRGAHAFTIGFEENEADDELGFARDTATMFGAEHHTMVVGPKDYRDYFDRYVVDLEEPVMNDSAPATHFLSRLARQHVKVVLSGQGADEPLAGYDRYKGEYLAPWFRRLRFLSRLEPFVEKSAAPEKVKRAFRSLDEPDDLRRALRIYAVFQEEEKRRLLLPGFRGESDIAEPIARFHREASHLPPLGRMLYTDTRTWLVDDLLLVADKLSMAHGIELRVPFLDHRLIELLESFPDNQKLELTRRGFVTKRVHRSAMAKRLPQEILTRKKRGFNNPLDVWLRNQLRNTIEERLIHGDSPIFSWIDRAAVRSCFEEHLGGRHDRRRQLFLLLTLDGWARAFL